MKKSILMHCGKYYGKDAIAIIGVGCRFPGAIASESEFFKVLLAKKDLITTVPEDRFDLKRFSHPSGSVKGRSVTFRAGTVGDVRLFDAEFFGMSVPEAASLDPQQRLVLEMSYEALEDALIVPSSIKGSNAAVVIGAASTDMAMQRADDPETAGPYSMTGTNLSIISNRLSYFYDLKGPSFTLDTACSSSLTALHNACEYLRSGRVDLALAGGVNILLSPLPFIGFSQAHMLSPTGHCKVFCEEADGYVRSEGGAVVILKRLCDAVEAGDPIKAVIAASDINQDGRTRGIALPNEKAQEELLKSLYGKEHTSYKNLVYFEAHGTGTKAGDPIECEAIGKAVAEKISDHPLLIGSVKANVGHLETASGMAGLIKSLGILRHSKIPGQKLYGSLNTNIDFAGLNLKVSEDTLELPATDGPALIGINSFGFGGANAHVVLAAYDSSFIEASPAVFTADKAQMPLDNSSAAVSSDIKLKDDDKLYQPFSCPSYDCSCDDSSSDSKRRSDVKEGSCDGRTYEILITAKSLDALRSLAGSYAGFLNEDNFKDVAATAALKRELYPVRLLASGDNVKDLCKALSQFASKKSEFKLSGSDIAASYEVSEPKTGKILGKLTIGKALSHGKTALVFCGNGSQYAGMAVKLYQEDKDFQEALDKVDTLLLEEQKVSPAALLKDPQLPWDLDDPKVAQIFIFAIQVSLTLVLKKRGIRFDYFMGHSVGEVAAAWAAGLISLKNACKVIAKRSYFQAQTSTAGAMAAVRIDREALEALLSDKTFSSITIAGFNSQNSFTISGSHDEVALLCRRLKQQKCPAQLLKLNYAFHSSFMDPIKEDLLEALKGLDVQNDSKLDAKDAKNEKQQESKNKVHQGAVSDLDFRDYKEDESCPDGIFISTVTGDIKTSLDSSYWWANIREPVLFDTAVKKALKEGVSLFVEAGPQHILKTYLKDLIRENDSKAAVTGVIDKGHDDKKALDNKTDALRMFISALPQIAKEGRVNHQFKLPWHPFFKQVIWVKSTPECLNFFEKARGLLGRKAASGVYCNSLDESYGPVLADHRINGRCIMPMVGFLEMALELARSDPKLKLSDLLILNFEVKRPLVLSDGLMVVESSLDDQGKLRISSRAHLKDRELLEENVTARILPCAIEPCYENWDVKGSSFTEVKVTDFYEALNNAGLNYGPCFKAAADIRENKNCCLARALVNDTEDPKLIFPLGTLDAAFQIVFALIKGSLPHQSAIPGRMQYLPIGFKKLWFKDEFPKQGSIFIKLDNYSNQGSVLTFDVKAANSSGLVICSFEEVTFKRSWAGEQAKTCYEALVPLDRDKNFAASASPILKKWCSDTALQILTSKQDELGQALKEAALCALILSELKEDLPLHEPLDLDEFFDEFPDEEAIPRIEYALEILRRRNIVSCDEDARYILLEKNVLGLDKRALASELFLRDGKSFLTAYPLLCGGLGLKKRLDEPLVNPLLSLASFKACALIKAVSSVIQVLCHDALRRGYACNIVLAGPGSLKLVAALKKEILNAVVRVCLILQNDREKDSVKASLQELGLAGVKTITLDTAPKSLKSCDLVVRMPFSELLLSDLTKRLCCKRREPLLLLDLQSSFNDYYALSLSNPHKTLQSNIQDLKECTESLLFEAEDPDFSLRLYKFSCSNEDGADAGVEIESLDEEKLSTKSGLNDCSSGKKKEGQDWQEQEVKVKASAGKKEDLKEGDESFLVFNLKYLDASDQQQIADFLADGSTGNLTFTEDDLKKGDLLGTFNLLNSADTVDAADAAATAATAKDGAAKKNTADKADDSAVRKSFSDENLSQKGLEDDNFLKDLKDGKKTLLAVDLLGVNEQGLSSGAHNLILICSKLAELSQGTKETTGTKGTIFVVKDNAAGHALKVLLRTLRREFKLDRLTVLIVEDQQAQGSLSDGLACSDYNLNQTAASFFAFASLLRFLKGKDSCDCSFDSYSYQEYALKGDRLYAAAIFEQDKNSAFAKNIVTGSAATAATTAGHKDCAATATASDTAEYLENPKRKDEDPKACHRIIDNRNIQNLSLKIAKQGKLSSLIWEQNPFNTSPLLDDEVEIKTAATGLNFRDVMWALGLLPHEALRSGFSGVGLGLELSGTVLRAGKGAQQKGIRTGQKVIALAPQSMATVVRTKDFAVLPLPESLSFAQGAALPVVYFTAYWSLIEKARAFKGQSVLIHGAAGGVGLAAVNIAKDLGLEIYATAGSIKKREYLKILGIEHVYSSRDLNFVAQILKDTKGRGIDVVLNSLYDRQAALSLELLAPGGSFIELGKRDFYEDHPLYLKCFKDNISYFGVDADEILALYPQKAQEVMGQIILKLKEGSYHPVPITIFSASEAAAAFTAMKKASHIGKIVICQDYAFDYPFAKDQSEGADRDDRKEPNNSFKAPLDGGVGRGSIDYGGVRGSVDCGVGKEAMNCGVGTLPKQEQDQGQDQVQDRDHKKEQKQGQGADCDPRQDLRKDCAPRREQEQEQEQGGDGDSRHSGNCFGLVQCFDLVKDLKDPNRIFIVSGATGGIGQSLCKTLIDRGAKRVIALGRDRKDLFFDERLTFISVDLNEANSNLRTSFKKAVESLNLKEGSLFTFIHAAGFTNDKNALSVTSEDFASMAAVKYHAPADIIAVLKSFGQLDSFLGLSSVTTLAGNIGQASYVLGNSLLESLAKRLQKEGVRAAALALGPVKGLGMLKDQPRLLESFERFFGMRGLDITEILNFLFHEGEWSGSRRHFENAVVHFFAASSNKLLSAFKDDLRSCCLSLRAGIDANEDSDGLKEKLKLLGKKERFALLEDLGAQLLASLMGVSKDTLDPKAKISSLGLDSLLVMEFAGLLEEKLEVKIPLSLFDTNASLSSVAEALEGLMFSDAVPQASFTQAKDLGTIGTAAVMPSAKNDAGVNSALEGDLGEDDTISLLQRQHGLAVTDNLKKQLTTDSKGN